MIPMQPRFRAYACIEVEREDMNPKLTLLQRNQIAWCLRQGRFTIGQTQTDYQVVAEIAHQIHQRTGSRVAIITDTTSAAIAVLAAADDLEISVSLSLEPSVLCQTGVKVIQSEGAHLLWDFLLEDYFDAVLFVGVGAMAMPPNVYEAIMEHCPFIGVIGALRAPEHSLFELHGSRVGAFMPAADAAMWIH